MNVETLEYSLLLLVILPILNSVRMRRWRGTILERELAVNSNGDRGNYL